MKCKLDEMALNLNEKRNLQKFLTLHEKICTDIKKHCKYSLNFSGGNGIGVSTKVVCGTCGKGHDITDYGAW